MNTADNLPAALIIPAGGSGKRLGYAVPKQYLEIGGKELIVRSIELFKDIHEIGHIIISAHPDWIDHLKKLCAKYFSDYNISIVEGGKERQDSVYNALKSINESCEIILIHDAVRIFAETILIKKLILTALDKGAAVPAVVPKNTIKSVKENVVIETLNRDELREIHTPQVFRREIIEKAYMKAYSEGFYGTDDASLVEYAGFKVETIESSYDNIKITTYTDLYLAELMIKKHKEEQT